MKSLLAAALSVLLCPATALAQDTAGEPALPPGLAPSATSKTAEPSLPPGLGPAAPTRQSQDPALPPGLTPEPQQADPDQELGSVENESTPLKLHGFLELRAAPRVQRDNTHSGNLILGELRLQLQTDYRWNDIAFEFTGDLAGDGVSEKLEDDVRRLRLVTSLSDNLDLSLGRQVLTWGTGHFLFINDLFPKDWQGFLIGRDEEYLKAPANAAKLSWFTELANIDLVYTPRFAPDRFIQGERVSFFSPLLGRRAGEDDQAQWDAPNDYIDDAEYALRIYRTVGSAEIALYGYRGYWKSPGGQNLLPLRSTFPELNVVGTSLRLPLGKGIFNAEAGYYNSRKDSGGDNPFINNSQVRLLLGYEQELATELTGALQYYVEHTLDYDAYRNTLPFLFKPVDEFRQVITLNLTKFLLNQDLTLSSFLAYSPTDVDGFWRPRISYKVTDALRMDLGGNLFYGRKSHTFYGQFENNSSVYLSARYSF